LKRGALLLLPWLAGCGVSTLDEAAMDAPTRNQCESDADCGDGFCAPGGMCRARSGTFSSVLFEVTVPTSARSNGGVQYLKRIDQLSLAGGMQDIALAELAQLKGTIVASSAAKAASGAPCDPSTATFNVALTPSERVLGLGVSSYSVKATPPRDAEQLHTFMLNLPPADYDIYVRPETQPAGGPGCEIAPQLYRRQSIPEGGNVGLPLSLPAPAWLELRVRWPAAQGLEGWRADAIDPETRTVLSNEAVLGAREGEEYVATLAYSPVVGSKVAEARELVRLRPPEGQAAPTILLERSGLEVMTPGIARVDQLTELPPVLSVRGQVVVSDSLQAVSGAKITVSATDLDAPGIKPGVPVEYFQEATSDSKGNFDVQLLPGTYRVVAVPPSGSAYATRVDEWVVSDSSNRPQQEGRTVEVKPLVNMFGRVLTAGGGAPVSGVNVNVAASPASLVENPPNPINPPDREALLVPRAGTDILARDGGFVIGAEPGTYNFSVRPSYDSGFGWLVRPGVVVNANGPAVDLGTLSMPLPLEYWGEVSAVDKSTRETVGGALIRAYVYVTSQHSYVSDLSQAASVLQIGETRADDAGRFQLFLPDHLD